MELAIIAAGESSRIKSEGILLPKPLIRLNDESIIERIVGIAVKNGVDKIHCIVNESETQLKEFLTSWQLPVPVRIVVKSTPSSMHSLFELSSGLQDSPFCLMTADTVFNEKEFASFISHSSSSSSDGVLAVTGFIDDEKPLCVAMDETLRITEFSDSQQGYSWATGGIYYLSPRIFSEIPRATERNINRLRNFFRFLLERKFVLTGYPFEKIIDVDHYRDVELAREFVCKG